MADAKISALASLAAASVAATDSVPIVNGGATKRITAANLLPGAANVTQDPLIFPAGASDAKTWFRFTPRHSDNPPFTMVGAESANFDGTYNFVFTLGHNVDSSGARIDTAKGAVQMHMESKWRPDATTSMQECHISFTSPSGTNVRVISFNKNTDASDTIGYAHYMSADQFQFWRPSDGLPWANFGRTGVTFTTIDGTPRTFGWDMNTAGVVALAATGGRLDITAGSNKVTVPGCEFDPALGTGGALKLTFELRLHSTLGIQGTATINAGNLAMDNDRGIYFKSASGTQFAAVLVDSTNTVSYRNTLAANSNTAYGSSSASNTTGHVYVYAKGQPIVDILPTGELKVNPDGGASAAGRILTAWQSSSQAADLFAVMPFGGSTPFGGFDKDGYLFTSKTSAPADGSLAAGKVMLWFDSTNGAAKLKIKAKQADGTVVSGEVALA